jgi:hypothetical protein
MGPKRRSAKRWSRAFDLDLVAVRSEIVVSKWCSFYYQTLSKSLQENIDTTTSGGKLVFHIFGALAEFEREIIKERTLAGLGSARARGKVGGRPKP